MRARGRDQGEGALFEGLDPVGAAEGLEDVLEVASGAADDGQLGAQHHFLEAFDVGFAAPQGDRAFYQPGIAGPFQPVVEVGHREGVAEFFVNR